MNDVNDAISRQQAIETFKDCAVNGVGIDGIVDALNQLPPIQPKRGKWIKFSEHGTCPYCGNCVDLVGGKENNFCSECGADMRGEQDE